MLLLRSSSSSRGHRALLSPAVYSLGAFQSSSLSSSSPSQSPLATTSSVSPALGGAARRHFRPFIPQRSQSRSISSYSFKTNALVRDRHCSASASLLSAPPSRVTLPPSPLQQQNIQQSLGIRGSGALRLFSPSTSRLFSPSASRSFSTSTSQWHDRPTYDPSHFVRKRRHGFLSRIRTRNGRRTLRRRRLKGRKNLSH